MDKRFSDFSNKLTNLIQILLIVPSPLFERISIQTQRLDTLVVKREKLHCALCVINATETHCGLPVTP